MKNIFLMALLWLLAAIPALSLDYAINLMWLYKKENTEEKFVFPDKYEKSDIKEDIHEWAEKNPSAPINFWYNSAKVSPEQIKNTEELFDNINKTLKRADENDIALKDVQSLKLVQEYPQIFTNNDIPIYFFTDSLRIEIAIEALKACPSTCYSVYADLSVQPMSETELFDDNTMMKLGKFGAIFAKGPKKGALGTLNLEHIFHIVANNKPKLLEALKDIVIIPNMERAKNALEGKLKTTVTPQTKTLESLIFFSIPRLFEYFYHLEGLGQLLKAGKPYDKNTNGAHLYDTLRPTTNWRKGWVFKPIDNSIWNEALNEIRIPTKQVISTRVREVQEVPATNDVQVLPISPIPSSPTTK